MLRCCLALAACLVAACSSSSSPTAIANDAAIPDADDRDSGAPDDAASASDALDASQAADADKSATCVGTFGQQIGAVGFARFDGTVVAILAPGNKTCPAPNSTHLVLELSFAGAVYRMVVDVDDTSARGTIHAHTITRPAIGGAWQDGWHAVPLDYVKDLGQKASDFTSSSTADAVRAITDALALGAHVSVFATAQGENDSAHLIHRNAPNQDGAIVVDPDSAAPTWLLLAFADQVF